MRFSGFGLWSASGESGVESGEKRLAERSQSATSRCRAADGSRAIAIHTINQDEQTKCCGLERNQRKPGAAFLAVGLGKAIRHLSKEVISNLLLHF
jgi:hypothetical protein